ncbi:MULTISPECIES: BlaI/MecI/CopY family transcriptional regulator [unclassified Variovorax]|uniref:BlaI/MecI/CopY family transcriptional regulator n=1 Tax=unclassified Variovorax TaxID=663243 RepID=UPI0008CA9C3D|nr:MULTISPECIES: BlaI/MecI/CopY family transcriptional regulator [unclassified Variovorax]SEK12165.1 hypothetical protein SAMN05518853_11125 [Variovorax sp. OK202]SFD79608.1 hypothetical protein SAMN05444746_11125 [Variovorax sp. OK212]
MTTPNKPQKNPGDHRGALLGPKRAQASRQGDQFIQLRPSLQARELIVLNAVSTLPTECHTPTAAVLELMRRDLGIPYSTLAAIIRRLERKGALRLGRVKPLP